MMLVRNDPAAVDLFKTILANALSPVPPEDNVGWGENGHVIHYVKTFPGLKILGTEWNNNQNPALRDYIRHYSAGPMRQYYSFTASEKVIANAGSLYSKIARRLSSNCGASEFYARLDTLMRVVAANYPGVVQL